MSEGRYQVDMDRLPCDFPTHRHPVVFWEQLGRTVATFGYLEEVLGRAIFALTATREYSPHEIDKAYAKWLAQLEHAAYDPLGSLINEYASALKNHHKLAVANPKQLIEDLRAASSLRNVLCHGSWQLPDAEGRSLPRFVDKRMNVFATPIDVAYLQQIRDQVVSLSCAVVNTVSSLGLRFPGSTGPGRSILESLPKHTPWIFFRQRSMDICTFCYIELCTWNATQVQICIKYTV